MECREESGVVYCHLILIPFYSFLRREGEHWDKGWSRGTEWNILLYSNHIFHHNSSFSNLLRRESECQEGQGNIRRER